MQITDETKEFTTRHRFGTDKLRVSSNSYGEHETPSVFLQAYDPSTDSYAGFGTSDTEQIKEIIEHMAKMAGMSVTFDQFVPQYQPGDRVRTRSKDYNGRLGTVLSDTENIFDWNVAVILDGETDRGLYTYTELELVTKSSI